MTFENLIRGMNPQIYRNLRTALELGKWPDGRTLSEDQKSLCMEAVIWYENMHNVAAEDRVGYIDRTGKTSPCETPQGEPATGPGGVGYWH